MTESCAECLPTAECDYHFTTRLARERDAARVEVEKLKALLAEAQSGLMCDRYREAWERCDCAVCAVKTRIDAALAEPLPEDTR